MSLAFPALAGRFFTTAPSEKPMKCLDSQNHVGWWLLRVTEEENGNLLFNGYRASVLQHEKSSVDGWMVFTVTQQCICT